MSYPSFMVLALLVWASLTAAHPAASLTSFPEETTTTEAEALSEDECLKALEEFPEVSTCYKAWRKCN